MQFLDSGNFIDLINQKFYDGLYIHRIVPDYCIQFGCPNAINPHVYVSRILVGGTNMLSKKLTMYLSQRQYGTLEEQGIGEGAGPPETSFKSCTGKEHTRDEYGNIEDELIKDFSNKEGTLSMANSG